MKVRHRETKTRGKTKRQYLNECMSYYKKILQANVPMTFSKVKGENINKEKE